MTECSLQRCQNCPTKGILVGSRGPIDSPFVILGESPGREEVKKRLPFVGPSNVVLQAALSQFPAGSYPEPYITNAFKCFPGSSDKQELLPQATQACSGSLMSELKAHPRRVILALGNAALWAATGNYNLRITRERGKLHPGLLAGTVVVGATHPAFLLRGNGSLRQFKADVAYAVSLAQGKPARSFVEPTWEVLQNERQVLALAKLFQSWEVNRIASDIETSGFSFLSDRILCAGFTYNGNHVYVIPEHLIKYTRALFQNMAEFVWHNGKFDVKFFHAIGIPEARVNHDTMLMSYALDETRGIHDLEQVSSDWLGSPNWKGVIEQHLPKKGASYSHIPKPVLYKYMAFDIANTFRLTDILMPLIHNDKLSTKQYYRTLIPASSFLAKVEENGIMVDKAVVMKNHEDFQGEVNKYGQELLNIAKQVAPTSTSFTDKMPNSPKQLSYLFFDVLGFKLKGNRRSTDEDALKEFPSHPAVEALKKYRKVQKLHSTYVKPAIEKVDRDGRIHSSYLIHGTATGRLASRDPNLQNIPRDPRIRDQFIPRPGYCFIEVDLNQAELRSLAALSGDPELIRIYTTSGMSLHDEVRADIYGNRENWNDLQIQAYQSQFYLQDTPTDKLVGRILEEQKMRAKAVNFGIVYGRTAPSLAEEFKIHMVEAQRWINAWFARFPLAQRFIQDCRDASIRGRNLITVFGYKKRFGVITPENIGNIQNESANFPHQSTASTITLHGGIECAGKLEKWGIFVCNTVHDSILMEVPLNKDLILESTDYVKATLESIPPRWGITKVPFLAEAKGGESWGKLRDLEKKFLPTIF